MRHNRENSTIIVSACLVESVVRETMEGARMGVKQGAVRLRWLCGSSNLGGNQPPACRYAAVKSALTPAMQAERPRFLPWGHNKHLRLSQVIMFRVAVPSLSSHAGGRAHGVRTTWGISTHTIWRALGGGWRGPVQHLTHWNGSKTPILGSMRQGLNGVETPWEYTVWDIRVRLAVTTLRTVLSQIPRASREDIARIAGSRVLGNRGAYLTNKVFERGAHQSCQARVILLCTIPPHCPTVTWTSISIYMFRNPDELTNDSGGHSRPHYRNMAALLL